MKKGFKIRPGWVLIALVVIGFFVLAMLNARNGTTQPVNESVTYSQFLDDINDKKVAEAEIGSQRITYTIEGDDAATYTTQVIYDPGLVDRLQEAGADFKAVSTQAAATTPVFSGITALILPFVLLWLVIWGISRYMRNRIFYSMFRPPRGRRVRGKHFSATIREVPPKGEKKEGEEAEEEDESESFTFGSGRMFTGFGNPMGASNVKQYKPEMTKTLFSDVAGQEEAKNSLQEIVSFLHDPAKYNEIGAKMPKGLLLVGPPGTGKTLLARAVAGEAGVPFFHISGSEFVEMFVGRGAARVRDLFATARKNAPCIVFIDEIDTIGKKRDGGGYSGNDEREQTLNQLLAELDGFDGAKGIMLLGATNRPDTLDPALTRPGRFDRRIPVELPDLEGRKAILELHARKVKTEPNIAYDFVARACAGSSGADLANIINESALHAVRAGRTQVSQKDMEEAIETVLAGEKKKNKVMSEKERMIVSYHEIGHALVAAQSKHAAPVHKITIIPRTKGSLGYTMQVDEEENNLLSKEELYTRIVTYCAGRAAEDLIFNSVTSGASNDIEMATRTARMMVTRLGMSQEFGMMALETVNNVYLGGDASLNCSEETASRIDREVHELIERAYQDAYQILQDNVVKLHELAKFLYEKETITGEEFMDILSQPAAPIALT